MNTYAESRFESPTLPRAVAVLLCLAVATLAAGCGEPLELEALSVHEAPMTTVETPCQGDNCPDPTNTNGIFIAEGDGYCIPDKDRAAFFCPEYFVTSVYTNSVTLYGQRVFAGAPWPASPEYISSQVLGWLGSQSVQVRSIATDAEGGLVVQVTDGNVVQTLSGSTLAGLRLGFVSGSFAFYLQFSNFEEHPGNGKTFWQYKVDYQVPALMGSTSWAPYCADGSGMAAFLKGRTVDSVTAAVNASSTIGYHKTTMACVSGAIGGCMRWGFRPWEAASGTQTQANTRYGACLQAKRAAYFVQFGDYKSYTTKGTPLSVQDNAGDMYPAVLTMPGLEAEWTPNGATCFNPMDRRRPAPNNGLPPLPAAIPVGPCLSTHRTAALNGSLPSMLGDNAPLATGPAP